MPDSPFKLIIEDDEGKRSVVPVELGEVTIGRLDGNTIRLNERNVSRHHARLSRDNGSVFAEDLDSYNGVFINGDRISGKAPVHEGDLIQIGDFHLELRGEGLQRRSEETTQRTIMPGMETTQPEIRVPGQPETDPSIQMPEERAEPTAIIRLDHLQDLQDAQTGRAGAIAGQKAKLLCVSTNLAGTEYEVIKTESVIGRTEDNDIQIDHRSVSRHHAKIQVAGNAYKIVDMGSANGTLVNGEQYAQVDLKVGDQIELGHVKFRFVPPGATYNLTDEERTATGRARGGTAPAQPATTEVMMADAVGGGGAAGALKSNPMLAAGVGGLFVILIVLVTWLIATSGDDKPQVVTAQPAVTPTIPTVPAAGVSPELQQQLGKIRRFIEQRQWKKALLRSELVLEENPGNPIALQYKGQAEREQLSETAYNDANRAIGQSDWGQAWNKLSEIPQTSVYYSQAAPLREQVRGALEVERINSARECESKEDWDCMAEAIEELEALNPSRPELGALKTSLAGGQEKASGSASAPTASSSRPSTRKSSGRKTSSRISKPKTEPKPEPKPAPKPPPAAAAGGGDAKSHYVKGTKALTGGRMQEAIQLFSKCVQIDRTFCLCYRALGIAYARSGNGPKAARYYKLYLKFCPSAKDADQVRKLLQAYGG